MTIQHIFNTTICSIFLTGKNHHCNQMCCSDDFKRRTVNRRVWIIFSNVIQT